MSALLTKIPGPKAIEWVSIQKLFIGGPVAYFDIMKERYGDFYRYRIVNQKYLCVHDPKIIETLLIKHNSDLKKDVVTHSLDDLLGKGLLTNEGDSWKKQRKLISPSLSRKQIASYANTITAFTKECFTDWEDGKELDTQKEMMALTLRIVMKTLLGINQDDLTKKAGNAIDDTMTSFVKEHHSAWAMVPKFIPTTHRKTYKASIKILEDIIYEVIAKRREENGDSDDLLNRLLLSTDEDGNAMSDKQLRDEALTMFLAGHETTALSITHMLRFLARYPVHLKKAVDEIDQVLEGKDPSLEHLSELVFLDAVAKESMRLYPPAWLIAREVLNDFQIDGIHFKKGLQVSIPICAIHKDQRWYKDPEEFIPERWLDDSLKDNSRFAYFPFGGGARICIGKHFAMMEMLLVVSTILQKFKIEDVSKEELEVEPSVTLRPTTPILLKVTQRI